MAKSKPLFLGAVLCGWLVPSAPGQIPGRVQPQLRDPAKPNIILILADDVGYGDLGCYGQERTKTPHLDQLAAEGMRFTQCYAGSCFSAPSRAALLTGQHTGHLSIRGDAEISLRAEDLTVAEVLRCVSYKTGAVGQWGLGSPGSDGMPSKQGFDEWFGHLGLTHAQDHYPTQLWRNDLPRIMERNLRGARGQHAQDLFTMVASNYVRVTRFFPFFLYVAYTIPGARTNAAMISRLDADVGSLLGQLKQLGLDEQTIVFFSSDKGPHAEGDLQPGSSPGTGPFRSQEGDLREGRLRVPMMVRWPRRIAAGSVSDQVWAFWDFLPTAAEIGGTPPPRNSDGISMLPTLLGAKQTNQHDYLYWEIHQPTFQQAIRIGKWKGLRLGPGQPLQLYNLTSDPGENSDVATDHPAVIKKLEACLKAARTDDTPAPAGSP